MKLICKANGKQLKVGSTVTYDGQKCIIYKIDGSNIGLERISDGVSWDFVQPDYFGAVWDEEDFVSYFFTHRHLPCAA